MELKLLPPPQVISNEVLSRHNVYGVSFNGISSNGRPLYNSIDQKWVPATTTSPGIDTWKDLAPFNVKKCITDYDESDPSKRKVLAYEGDENYNTLKADKTGDRMIEFPMGYYYRPDPWTFIVSPDPIEGFYPSPACDLGNGTILRGFRLSEFDLCYVSSVPRSIPGYVPWGNVSSQFIKDSLKPKGQYLETFGAWCWINFLRFIKQQNLNSQKVNGMGICAGNATSVMVEDNIQGLDGYININAINNVRTLGLQNFYGHVCNFLHNVLVHSANEVWIKKDFINADTWPAYSDAIPKGWEKLSVPLSETDTRTWISELAWNFNELWALYPSKLGGNYVEPIGDTYWSRYISSFSPVVVGGGAWGDSYVGSLYWDSGINIDGGDWKFGGRSLEIVL